MLELPSREEQLKQLTATAGEATESPESDDTGDQGAGDVVQDSDAPVGFWERVRRWIAGEPREGR